MLPYHPCPCFLCFSILPFVCCRPWDFILLILVMLTVFSEEQNLWTLSYSTSCPQSCFQKPNLCSSRNVKKNISYKTTDEIMGWDLVVNLYVFCVIIRTNSDYYFFFFFFCNRDRVFSRGTSWMFYIWFRLTFFFKESRQGTFAVISWRFPNNWNITLIRL
jgi:hypothetical protein